VLVTLDVPNNFPQLPVRTDGPYLVWLGIVRDTRRWRLSLLRWQSALWNPFQLRASSEAHQSW